MFRWCRACARTCMCSIKAKCLRKELRRRCSAIRMLSRCIWANRLCEARRRMLEALKVDDLHAGYGSAAVLHGVSFVVNKGETAVLLGANGVGKTTTLRAISGVIHPWSGRIEIAGDVVDRSTPEAIVRRGLGMVPGP